MAASLACWRVSMATASTSKPPATLPRQYARDATKWSRYNMLLTFRNDVCMMGLNPNVSLARAGAVAQYVSGIVIFCGGQSHQNPAHKDCLYYSPLGCEIFGFFLLSFPQNERNYISFAQFVCFLREVCLLFNFLVIKFQNEPQDFDFFNCQLGAKPSFYMKFIAT